MIIIMDRLTRHVLVMRMTNHRRWKQIACTFMLKGEHRWLLRMDIVCMFTCSIPGKDDGREVHLKTPRTDKPYALPTARRHARGVHGQVWQGDGRGFSLWYVAHNYMKLLVVGFCGQPHYCYQPYYPTARFPSPSSYMVSDEPFPDRSRPMSC